MKWKNTLATVAPTIASALGGPVAGLAVKVACDALGIEGGDIDSLESAIATGDPEVMLKIKDAESRFILEAKRLEIDLVKVNNENTDSARDLAKSKGIAVQAGLTILIVGAFTYVMSMVFSGGEVIHSTMRDVGIMLVGALVAELTRVLNFWFGSSSGSKAKTDQIEKVIK